MTTLPASTDRKLGLVIDLDICVGCHACVVSCKEWNTGAYGAPLSDQDAYGDEPTGSWLNRVHTFEVTPHSVSSSGSTRGSGATGTDPRIKSEGDTQSTARVVHFPKSCLHCEDAPCVTVCPTGASFKRSDDGIVLVNESTCIGCGLCAWACPYGAREMDGAEKVMKKCTLCVDRIYNENIPEEDRVPSCVRTCPAKARHFGDLADPTSDVSIMVKDRGGFDLMPEQGTKPVNKYLPPRPKQEDLDEPVNLASLAEPTATGFLGWLDNALTRIG